MQLTSPQVDDAVCLPVRALYTAQLLVGAVRDGNAEQVARRIGDLPAQQLRELAVTLAALVPYDNSIRQLLAWNDEQWHVRGRKVQRLRPHGTHAAYTRHRTHGEPACDECAQAERDYQRVRDRRRRSSRHALEEAIG